MEVIVVSSTNSGNTLTAVFLTQTGAGAFKEMLSQPKVSMHSSLSQAEAPDYRNKHKPAQRRSNVIFIPAGRDGDN